MRDIKEIFKKVSQQKTELQLKGIETKYLFIDKTTYKELKYNAIKFVETHFEYTTYLSKDKFMGLLVIPVASNEELISVGV